MTQAYTALNPQRIPKHRHRAQLSRSQIFDRAVCLHPVKLPGIPLGLGKIFLTSASHFWLNNMQSQYSYQTIYINIVKIPPPLIDFSHEIWEKRTAQSSTVQAHTARNKWYVLLVFSSSCTHLLSFKSAAWKVISLSMLGHLLCACPLMIYPLFILALLLFFS